MIHRSPAKNVTFAKGCAGHMDQGQQRNPEGSGHRRVLEKGLRLVGHLEEVFMGRGRRIKTPGRQGAAGKPVLEKP